jgi:hypothetical protein
LPTPGKQRAAALLAGLALIAIPAGCGSSTDATTTAKQGYTVRALTTMETANPPIDKREFVALTNRICHVGWKTVQRHFIEYWSWRKPPETRQERLEKSIRLSLFAGIDFHIFDQIQHMGAARGQTRQAEEVIGALQKSIELGQHGYWRAHVLTEVSPHFGDFNRRARQYGLEECPVNKDNLRPIEVAVEPSRNSSPR